MSGMALLRCPACRGPLVGGDALRCRGCGARYSANEGVFDLAPRLPQDSSSRAQRAMNHPLFARLYETPLWRPLHTRLASGRRLEEEVRALLQLAGGKPKRRVDLACGTGVYARAMAEPPDATVLGLDISRAMLVRARRLAGGRVAFVRGDVHHLPLGDASVDHVNCAGALHLFSEPEAVLWEIFRVLAPGGVFTAMTAVRAPAPLDALLRAIVPFQPFAEETLMGLLRSCGFVGLQAERRRAVLLLRAARPDR